MSSRSSRYATWRALALTALVLATLFPLRRAFAQADKPSNPPTAPAPTGHDENAPPGTVKLKIVVTNPRGTPVSNASVYVRYYKEGGLMHHDQLAELDLKTGQDGAAKVPGVPQGKIQIQVVATGWHTFGEWYDIEKEEQTVSIQLQEPPHWY
ncbi:MAG TPA: carboxypeptidase-like regulatory domain-containing protein [Candidatus Acidoferrum sp.]|jgi:hypothetical protein|nr:carboxypeptidase-like regulatory domain-containing protein [Candidatus Acidoferrum sp.]